MPHENIRVLRQKPEGGRIGPSIDPGRDGVVEGLSETSPALEDLSRAGVSESPCVLRYRGPQTAS